MKASLIRRIKRLEEVLHVKPERYYVTLIGPFFGPYDVFAESTYMSLLKEGKRFTELIGPFNTLREARVWCLEHYEENFPELFQKTLRHNSIEELLEVEEWKLDRGIIYTREAFARDVWPADDPEVKEQLAHSY